jgi:hypothetical protein
MTRYDVGKLNRGDRVTVGGKLGTVTSPHEPEWIDNKTKEFRKEFQGADIQFDGEPGHSVYIHADSITILEANVRALASLPARAGVQLGKGF